MKLGAFSNSLSVKDLSVSKAFYEKLGFTVFAGASEKNYFIMKNGNALVGLFQGMFEGNLMIFNPGWDENAQNVSEFDDVRAIQKHLEDPLAEEILTGDVKEGDLIITDLDEENQKLVFKIKTGKGTKKEDPTENVK